MAKISKLKPPRISFSAVGQIIFVFKEAFKIIWAVEPVILLGVMVLGTIWGLTTLPTLYLGKAIIDTSLGAIPKSDPERVQAVYQVAVFIILLTLVNIIRQVASSLTNTFRFRLNLSADAYMDRTLSQKFGTLDIVTIESPEFRDRFEKIKKEGYQRLWGLVYVMAQVPQNLSGVISSLAPIFLFSPLLLVVIIILQLPVLAYDRVMTKKDYDLNSQAANKNRVWGMILHLLVSPRNPMEAKLLGNTKSLVDKMHTLQDEVVMPRAKLRTNWVIFDSIFSIPPWIFSGGLDIWLFIQVIFARMTLGTAQLIFNAYNNFSNYFVDLIGNILQIYEHYLYVIDFVWLMNLKPQMSNGKKKVSLKPLAGIEFKDVWFRYPGNNSWVLKGINLKISPTDNIAIVGENGAGKTTLIKLLGRFYQPTKGEVLFNGVNINNYDEVSYWRNMAVLFQDFETYSFSAKEAVGYGDPARLSNFSEIVDAAKQAGIHDYIESLKAGYDTPLQRDLEGGITPSGGQLQRIALARTIFRRANIVILDEPTSNVDPKAEEEIFDKIMALTRKKILILISHRFSTVRLADQIIVLHKGEVVEQGSHEELMRLSGHYAKLYNLQAKWYK
ncbi:MAG: ATP-binding cassette domain-containing protein [Patescibacteria group bacterium]|nr:ATP-binding cassette domain-containing protein [Patescibacteria group bacterium]MCL5431883.1 ATP-binding cassette domain-containing protein [Patescibacteria group bacterium]